MEVMDTNLRSLIHSLKLEDPWLPPTTWESIPSQSGRPPCNSLTSTAPHFAASSVSEASLTRLALSALQGVQSAVISIGKFSAAFSSDPADRTFHQIPSLWNRSSSTHALGKILNSIGCSGFLVFLLFRFVDYFTNLHLDDNSVGERQKYSESAKTENDCDSGVKDNGHPAYSLVNQAFAVAVGKVLEGYICALDTLHASVGLRRSTTSIDVPTPGVGCLTSVVHSEITLLEVYLHTKELRTQVEALGNICNLHHVALCFSASLFEDLTAKAALEFRNFCRGGDLLTYLYTQLQVADPAHRALLKFLFLQSCEPYCGFIRSWIFKAEISDPYNEFVVEYVDNLPPDSRGKAGTSIDFPLASIRERERAAVPCFLKKCVIPLVRAGQQLQVLMKLFELCNYVTLGDQTYADCFPSWSSFSGNQFSASPITFSKGSIEALVLARNIYYKRMQEKLKSFLKELEFSFQLVAPSGNLAIFCGNGGGNSHTTVSFTMDDSLIVGTNLAVDAMDSNESTTEEECSSVVDISESSEFLSSCSSEEQTETEQPVEHPDLLEQTYLSALSFSTNGPINSSLPEPFQSKKLCHDERDSCDLYEIINSRGSPISTHLDRKISSKTSVPLGPNDMKGFCISDVLYMDSLPERAWPLGGLLKNPFYIDGRYRDDLRFQPSDSGLKVNNNSINDFNGVVQRFSKTIDLNGALMKETLSKNQLKGGASTASNLSTLQMYDMNADSNFLSKNPMLTKNAFFDPMTESGGRCKAGYGQALPCFDFSSVEDPCNVYMGKLASGSTHEYGNEVLLDFGTSAMGDKCSHKQGYGGKDISNDNSNVSCVYPLQDLKEHTKEGFPSPHGSGGSSWESLLSCFRISDDNTVGEQNHSLSSTFELPLDFTIDKCLLQEILLQYKYVSKLTIKLLEEGFDLRDHLLALRRYHFMEVADWADLFILSLWNHKWRVTEADQRVSETQGVLELSVQMSSCERDPYKERLFVYTKKQSVMPISTSAIGVHSFDFLGLGYRVDWPVSIVLTPGALKIYADIFSFLIQVKLAVFSLNDVWSSLKDLMQLVHQNCCSSLHDQEIGHLNILMKMRHQVNHFVCTLQQYVLSQLSDVSWCKFLHSLKHKVKDMMDLEAVHLSYLTDSLHICFLSGETRSVATIIESILQCALDFRSCLPRGIWDVGLGQGDPLGKLSRINISQVLAIKQSFDRNMRELHVCYLKSPKHMEFGLSRFWVYLNYNEYYSDFDQEMRQYAFSV